MSRTVSKHQNLGQTDEIVQREVFGPVVTVQRFADDDQAIEWANDVQYGLAAYKQSGYGKDLATYSLEDYTQIKHVMAKND